METEWYRNLFAVGLIVLSIFLTGCFGSENPKPQPWPLENPGAGEIVCIEGTVVDIIKASDPIPGYLVIFRVADEAKRLVRVTVFWLDTVNLPEKSGTYRVSGEYVDGIIHADHVVEVLNGIDSQY